MNLFLNMVCTQYKNNLHSYYTSCVKDQPTGLQFQAQAKPFMKIQAKNAVYEEKHSLN